MKSRIIIAVIVVCLIVIGVATRFLIAESINSSMSETTVLPDATSMGAVTLYVQDLSKVADFYVDKVGLFIRTQTENRMSIGTEKREILILEQRSLPYPSSQSAGLYHTAILFESKTALAKSLQRLLSTVPHLFEGSGDHLVSQAFYFHDPEGNGVELYVDRPRDQWKWQNGQVEIATLYIDPEEFIKENTTPQSTPVQTMVGHVHLKVGDIPTAKNFYVNVLGFDITAEMPTALFVSAGGYHHHLGMNTWESLGSGKRTETLGLGRFTILLGKEEAVQNLVSRLNDAHINVEKQENSFVTQDPWGNIITIGVQ